MAQAERNRLAPWEGEDPMYVEYDFNYYDSFFCDDDYPTDCMEIPDVYSFVERTLRAGATSLRTTWEINKIESRNAMFGIYE